jgi:hypothetical protein
LTFVKRMLLINYYYNDIQKKYGIDGKTRLVF